MADEYDEEEREDPRGMRACGFCGEAFCYCNMPPCQNCEILAARVGKLEEGLKTLQAEMSAAPEEWWNVLSWVYSRMEELGLKDKRGT